MGRTLPIVEDEDEDEDVVMGGAENPNEVLVRFIEAMLRFCTDVGIVETSFGMSNALEKENELVLKQWCLPAG